jgi:hypothetical protein
VISQPSRWVDLEEPRHGARGTLRRRGSRPHRFTILTWNPPRALAFEVELPGRAPTR